MSVPVAETKQRWGWKSTKLVFSVAAHRCHNNNQPVQPSPQRSVHRRRNVAEVFFQTQQKLPIRFVECVCHFFFFNKHTVHVNEAKQRGMHVYVDYCHSLNDGKRREWGEMAESRSHFVQIQHRQRESYVMSGCLVKTVASFNLNLCPPNYSLRSSEHNQIIQIIFIS